MRAFVDTSALLALSHTRDQYHERAIAIARQHQRTRWLARFADHRFSLADPVSFEVISRETVRHAFAFDRHFELAEVFALSDRAIGVFC